MRRAATVAAASLLALAAAGAARADGDPASDFLYLGTLFPSYSSPANGANGNELRGLLAASKRAGLPLKVALVSDKADLGQYPQLFGDPARYANLLASELAIYRPLRAPVIVVTPHGLGAAGREPRGARFVQVAPARAKALLAGIRAPSGSDGEALALVAIDAVHQVAKEEGHPLPAHVPPLADTSTTAATPGSKGKGHSAWLVAAGVAVLFFAAWLAFEIVASVRDRRRSTAASEQD
jgi:hypothetical protein